ncbi:FecR family protein [Terrimonas pollutisoli]|uniref:FecR family protein n=1 Tax=Terrimonas pollutisoli TaxID=3034147 RepID=UPI0023EDF30B|nr:FecR domain-containing protein [Terrimonas sp. H1YJ31]
MKSDKMDVADLLADESFINYCRRSSPEDVTFWENYIRENPERRLLVEYANEKFIQLFNALGEADMEEQAVRLKSRLDLLDLTEPAPVVQMEGFERKKSGHNFSLLLKLSAAAVLFIGLFLTINYYNNGRSKNSKTFLAAYGERKNIQLPDGSDVTLNAGSKIEINESFGVSTRDVYLEGEAFFDVKHNEKLPFIVHTPAMDVKALGTAFNVKAYLDERITETSLIRGLVEVTLKENNNLTMLLRPNQKIKWEHPFGDAGSAVVKSGDNLNVTDSLVKKLQVTDYGNIKEVAWKDNKLVFEDELFGDIAALLERWYGVEIEFNDDAIRNYRFTGVFEKEDINTVLDFLKESRRFNYTIEEGEPLKINLSK